MGQIDYTFIPIDGVAFSVKKFNDIFVIELLPIVFFVDAYVLKQNSFHCYFLSTPDTIEEFCVSSQYLFGVANDLHLKFDTW